MEDAVGEPFVGPSGALLKRTLERAGVDPDTVFRCNAASCYPSRSRTPGKTHLSACRVNLEDQLRISGARVVLVCGATALSAVTEKYRISAVRGRRLYWQMGLGRVVVATWHPAAVLRDHGKTQEFRGDVGLAARLSREGWQGAMGGWDESCLSCEAEREAEVYDEFGVGFCEEHRGGLPEGRGLAVGRKVQGVLLL
jgi:uracil-DNA glycosylase family 4